MSETPPSPAFPCPECGTPVAVSIDLLLSGEAVACANAECGVEFKIDGGRTPPPQAALEQVEAKLKALEEAIDRAKKDGES